jgi:hypothetical protein
MRFEPLRISTCLCAALFAYACASGQAHTNRPPADLSPASLYPLHEGAAWSYDVDAGDGDAVLATTRVLRVSGTQVEVMSGQAVLRYALLPDGIQRVDGGSFLLRAPVALDKQWAGTMGSQARVTALDQDIQTPAGKFESCVVVTEQGGDSGRKVATTYCPGVGPVVVVSEMVVRGKLLRVRATLRGYSLEAL